jgi:hypothetical protein
MGATSTIRIARAAALGVATLIGSGLSSPPARAAYTVTYEQEGSNVVASGMGTIDLAALSIFENASAEASMAPFEGILDTGPTSFTLVDEYQGAITGPTSFGSGLLLTAANSGSGDMVGISDGPVFGQPMVRCRAATSPEPPCRTWRPMTTRPSARSARRPAPTHGPGEVGRPRTASRSTS